MSDWNGQEMRSYHEIREIIREEIKPLQDNQETIKAKIAEWESGARWFRAFIIGTVSFVTAIAAAYEWLKDNIK